MNNKIRSAWVEVDIQKAVNNFEQIKNLVRKSNNVTKICAVVKANSYGMGSVELSKNYVISGVDMLAVAVISEAMELRERIKETEILILGYTPECYFDDAINNNITLTIFSYEQAVVLDKIARKLNKKAKIHIKVETGMNRLGLMPTNENAEVIKKIYDFPNIFIQGMFTHFVIADGKDKSTTHMQAKEFIRFAKLLEEKGVDIPIKHAGNSATIIDLPEYYFDMVRPGIILSGFYPSDDVDKSKLKIDPCITLKALLSNVKSIPPNSGVSYGHTFKARDKTVVGTIPLGYADGFSRSLSNNFYVIVKGKKCLLIGRICMDQFMIDLTNVDNPQVGDEVIIYGNGSDGALTIEDVANIRDTISYEVESTLSIRLPRKYI
ncbi:alanine racemase [Sedimentibacter sp. zth1]|uniref:alanine racemase n=1 Tax=Sedimentibacter sp. zth1 TaxID=2816908 RepID=UPI001A934EDA|nr:alanine racemase [Sedimentibacter sp. zth1]QSX05148.1 alanine racemase [Sedimentibacter sp. zth1]